MKNYLKTAPLGKSILIMLFVLFIFSSCKKESGLLPSLNSSQEKSQAIANKAIIQEKVDIGLLSKYMDYEMGVEADALLKKSGKNFHSMIPKINRQEFELMIENYLTNERNTLRKNALINSELNSFNKNTDFIPSVVLLDTVYVEGKGSFTEFNSISLIFFQARQATNNNTLYNSYFSFVGPSGTMTPAGGFFQQTYQGVTTYHQYYNETIYLSNGGQYNQLVVLYGNVYNGVATVHGMKVNN